MVANIFETTMTPESAENNNYDNAEI